MGIKDEQRIRQEYGVNKKMLKQLNRWYHKIKEKEYAPLEIHLKKSTKMKSKKKATEDHTKALEKEIADLKKQLE